MEEERRELSTENPSPFNKSIKTDIWAMLDSLAKTQVTSVDLEFYTQCVCKAFNIPPSKARECVAEWYRDKIHKDKLVKEKRLVKQKVEGQQLLTQELSNIIKAGDNLANAAHLVQSEYDGVHRLRLALAEWYKARANEYGRGKEIKSE